MNTAQPSLNGQLSAPPAAPMRSGWFWPVAVCGLIGINVVIVATTVYFAVSDQSVATEPDYYAKGLAWDETARLKAMSRELGWSTNITIAEDAKTAAPALRITFSDKASVPVENLSVTAVAFANVRSGERQQLHLEADPARPGSYTAPLIVNHPGLWHVRLEAKRDDKTFIHETDVLATAYSTK